MELEDRREHLRLLMWLHRDFVQDNDGEFADYEPPSVALHRLLSEPPESPETDEQKRRRRAREIAAFVAQTGE
jgi:hypothetical protein